MDYYVEPLKADFENLLGRFQQTDSVRYETFSAIWRSMDFSSIFYGGMSGCERRIFSRLALITAFYYFLPPYSFQIRAGGLYLLYGLYHTQLVTPRERITLALKDWENTMSFLQDALSSDHHDVVYILWKLFRQKAFCFAATPKPLSFQVKRKPQIHNVLDEFRDQPVRVGGLVTMETLQEMKNVQKHYERIKQGLSAPSGQRDPSLSLAHQDLVTHLHGSVMEYNQWVEKRQGAKKKNGTGTDDAGPAEEDSSVAESSKRAQLLASIKSRSYGHVMEASKSRRHRQVEMDSSGSGTDHYQETTTRKKKRAPSLSARTRTKLCSRADVKQEDMDFTRQWNLSVMDGQKEKKRPVKRFRW